MISAVEIERASYESWPAFEQIDYGGWILRAADGYTKRCNSVNVIAAAPHHLPEAIAHCEAFYRERNQPAIFRQCSFAEMPGLDSALADRGYRFIDPSLILYRPLARSANEIEKLITIDRSPWLKTFVELSGSDPAHQATHAQILERIPEPALFAVREHEGQPVACGLGVMRESYFGMFDIVTTKQDRRRGHGFELLTDMIGWAGRHGGRHAYVQVVGHNAPAIRLYEKLGYRRLYHYWYRVGPAPAARTH